MTDAISESTIKQAVKRRRDDILSNLETMTLKKCRRQLEEDLGLEQDALKPYKELLSKLIDMVIATATATKSAAEPGEAKSKATSDSPKAKRMKADTKKAHKPAQQAAVTKQHSRKVEKLRHICKEATITIPPNVYIKNKTNEGLEAAIEQLLEKQGLSVNSGKDDIAKVKKQLTLQRDLDGIDTSNIISEGGRRRRQAAVAPVNYRQMMDESDDQSEEESDSGESSLGSKGGLVSTAEMSQEGGVDNDTDGAENSDDEEKSPSAVTKVSGGAKQPEEAQESPDENKPSANGQPDPAGKGQASQNKVQTVNAVLDDCSDDDMQQGSKKPRAVMADWSDDD